MDNGFIQLSKGYRSEDAPTVEHRCEVHHRLPEKGKTGVVLFEDYMFEITNLGEKVRVVVKDFLYHEKFLAIFNLDAENGISGYFSSSQHYREVFCIIIEDYPGQFDD